VSEKSNLIDFKMKLMKLELQVMRRKVGGPAMCWYFFCSALRLFLALWDGRAGVSIH
jgi:hypothetical protein